MAPHENEEDPHSDENPTGAFLEAIRDIEAAGYNAFDVACMLKEKVKDVSKWFTAAGYWSVYSTSLPDTIKMRVFIPLLRVEARTPKKIASRRARR